MVGMKVSTRMFLLIKNYCHRHCLENFISIDRFLVGWIQHKFSVSIKFLDNFSSIKMDVIVL